WMSRTTMHSLRTSFCTRFSPISLLRSGYRYRAEIVPTCCPWFSTWRQSARDVDRTTQALLPTSCALTLALRQLFLLTRSVLECWRATSLVFRTDVGPLTT